jgi:hypothetical protein
VKSSASDRECWFVTRIVGRSSARWPSMERDDPGGNGTPRGPIPKYPRRANTSMA